MPTVVVIRCTAGLSEVPMAAVWTARNRVRVELDLVTEMGDDELTTVTEDGTEADHRARIVRRAGAAAP